MSRLISIAGFPNEKFEYDLVKPVVVSVGDEFHLISSPYIAKVNGKWVKSSDVDLVECFDGTRAIRSECKKLRNGAYFTNKHLESRVVSACAASGQYGETRKMARLSSRSYAFRDDENVVVSNRGYNLKDSCVKASKHSKYRYLTKSTAAKCAYSKEFFDRSEILVALPFDRKGNESVIVSKIFASKMSIESIIEDLYLESGVIRAAIGVYSNVGPSDAVFSELLGAKCFSDRVEYIEKKFKSLKSSSSLSSGLKTSISHISRTFGDFSEIPSKDMVANPSGINVVYGNINGGSVYFQPSDFSSRSVFSESLRETGGIGYTYGLEHETCVGIVPFTACESFGLTAVGDGSTRFQHRDHVVHYEYVTKPLHGDAGISNIRNYMPYIANNTLFNELCSTHIHVGGKSLGLKKTDMPIFNREFSAYLINLCCKIEKSITKYVPSYRDPKRNAQCRSLTGFGGIPDFSKMPIKTKKDRQRLIASFVFGANSLDRNHNKRTSLRKWGNEQRKHWLNLVNCNSTNGANRHNSFETVEFRLFPATRDADIAHIYVLMSLAIVWFAENRKRMIMDNESITIEDVLKEAYGDKDVYKFVLSMLERVDYTK